MSKIDAVGNIPQYAKPGDAGADLIASQDAVIPPGAQVLVKTGTSIAIPDSLVGMVCSRSGLAAKHGVFVLNSPGIIDSGFRGEIGVVLYNGGTESFEVKAGDRIAQLVLVRHVVAEFNEVQELDDTERGTDGFGSTGV